MTPFFKGFPKTETAVCICWLRRDLRLYDHHALSKALQSGKPVLCLFIYDEDILEKLEDKNDRRLSFISDALAQLRTALQKAGSDLLIGYGQVGEVWEMLLQHLTVEAVFANEDYEPYARTRDRKVEKYLGEKGIPFHQYPDQLIYRPGEILKDDGTPYTPFTPFRNKWRTKWQMNPPTAHPSEQHLEKLLQTKPLPGISLYETGFTYASYEVGDGEPDVGLLKEYASLRDLPALDATSRVGIHLRFGTVSVRRMLEKGMQWSDTWVNELIWREFFMHILYHFSHLPENAFKPAYDQIQWRNDPGDFEVWCQGKTGYPLVDAGMRQLNSTGFMHNRVRMVTASFLVKHLLIDWRWGEAWFAAKLLDFELSSNNGNWQWAAGSGCDAAPYFRIFNPITQQKKFDPEMKYIRRYIPEIQTDKYPLPIVEHPYARERCLQAFQAALKK